MSEALRAHPELTFFLTLAVGYALGRVRVGPLRLNAVIGVLIAGLVVGQIGIQIPAALQWAFFLLYLFATGFRIGPEFFSSLGRDALPHVGLAAFLCAAALASTMMAARAFGLDVGGAAGLLAGALTMSPTLGTAGDAIAKLPLDEPSRNEIMSHLSVAFAVTYLVGLLTVIGTLSRLGPRLMRVDLARKCRELEREMGLTEGDFGIASAYREFVARTYSIPTGFAVRTASELERSFAPARVFVERVRTSGGVIDTEPGTPLNAGDVIVLSGRREVLVGPQNPLREHETNDPALLDVPTVAVDVVVTNRRVLHRAMADIASVVGGEGIGRSVFVRTVKRAGIEIPLAPRTIVERGDVLTLVGVKTHVERVANLLGRAEWPTPATDMVTVAAAIAVGGLIGLATLRLRGLDIALSLPVGVLLGGMTVGWLRSIRPVFGRAPEPALWLFESLGLSGFLAAVGINTGPSFVEGIHTSGAVLLAAGVLVCLVPHVATILVGRYLFRVHPGVLLGICAGAGTSPAALSAVQDAAGSRIPTLGYGIAYAVGSVLLTFWGTIVVNVIHN